MATAELPRRWAWPALAVVLAGALGLRLWGVQQGLPYAYNTDEADHFVPRAVAMFGHSLNPHYFANPPGFTYVLHYLFAIAYGGTTGVRHAFAHDPTGVYTLSRVAAAVLGVIALWLLYATGARLFNRAVGLLAAAIEAVAFLPVFYAHLALNDVPTLAPLTLSLLGSAGVLRKGRKRDYVLAGVGLGLACATKYTAGIVVVPFVVAVISRALVRKDAPAHEEAVPRQDATAREGTAPPEAATPREADETMARDDARPGSKLVLRAAIGALLTLLAAAVAFFVANPYSLLDYKSFHAELVHQSTLSAEAQGKLGAPRQGGVVYYLWSLTWGFGWVPALAALGGAVAIWWRRVALGWLLVPAPVLFLAFMGLQGRYFGRWLMPILPLLCVLAAFFVLALAGWLAQLARRAPRGRLALAVAALLVALTLAQGLVYSVHSGVTLARADTRNITRSWLLANVPEHTKIVVEPVSPDGWARRYPGSEPPADNPYLWSKYPSLLSRISSTGALLSNGLKVVGIENYVRTLSPALIGYYERHGYCTVISGSTQSGRVFADPRAVPIAAAYYRALERAGEVVFRSSPYGVGEGPVAFGFDWSFDYYPLAYARPGPSMTVYRLHGGRCPR
jgi:4-amino-4-deoxy-L-arabinose transferase-like glycosyltransferase